ncbi:MAG: GIY-YIG nuclease family protein [Treponema sp.]|nr:GIY-YIG nuclease family protein [Treponema sp.]
MAEKGYVYFMTNQSNRVLYVGVTSDLDKRVAQHKKHEYGGFTASYNCNKLVYFEECNDIKMAIEREKQLKNWKRKWKNDLVNEFNKEWKDLSEEDSGSSPE